MTKIEWLIFQKIDGPKMKIYMLNRMAFLKKTSTDKTFDNNLTKFKCFYYQVHFNIFAKTCHNLLKITPEHFNLVKNLPNFLGKIQQSEV